MFAYCGKSASTRFSANITKSGDVWYADIIDFSKHSQEEIVSLTFTGIMNEIAEVCGSAPKEVGLDVRWGEPLIDAGCKE